MQKTLEDYIPKQALKEVVKVLRYGEKKHGDTWKIKSSHHHIAHASTHFVDSMVNNNKHDKDSHLSNLAHAACRALMALAVEIKMEKKKCSQKDQSVKNVD